MNSITRADVQDTAFFEAAEIRALAAREAARAAIEGVPDTREHACLPSDETVEAPALPPALHFE